MFLNGQFGLLNGFEKRYLLFKKALIDGVGQIE